MFCQLCGTKIEEGEYFCRNCGEISQTILFSEDKPDWLKRFGYFSLSVIVFLGVFFGLMFLLSPPNERTKSFVLLTILILSTVFFGLIGVLLFELKIVRKKLDEEREKRRIMFSNPKTQLIADKNFEAVPTSVIEHTTLKFPKKQ